MTVTLEFNGIKSKWGYSGWSKDGANPNVNKGIYGGELTINGTTYKQGIGTHAPSEIVFALDGKVRRFSCQIGPDQSGGASDTIVFKVFGDGRNLFESPVMRQGMVLPVNLDVTGVKELSLRVNYVDSDSWGHADWVNVKFEKTASAMSAPRVGQAKPVSSSVKSQTGKNASSAVPIAVKAR